MNVSGLLSADSQIKPFTRLFLSMVLVWFFFLVILVSFILNGEIHKNEQDFEQTADALYENLSNKVQTNESVIEGFASLLSNTQRYERQRVRGYAQRMLQRYPHIYMFEVAERIEKIRLNELVEYMRKNVYREFRVAAFDFDRQRQWQKLPDKQVYYPVTFIEPMYLESMSVLGLDLDSHDIFRQALQSSMQQDIPVVSRPFKLIEGQKGLLLHRAVDVDGQEISHSQYALLVIKAETLFPSSLIANHELFVRLYHRDYMQSDDRGEIYHQPGDRRSSLEQALFPCLSYIREINNPGQPFVLHIEHQLGFDDLNLPLLLVVVVIAAVSFWMMLVFARMHHRSEMHRLKYENRLYHMANNDSLTGLVNRNFLLDRMRQVLAKAKRKHSRFVVIFMDLDGFKQVNDNYGHAAGDQLLKRVAERFKACMREEDTVCRYHGDEFVILIEEYTSEQELEQIKDKLKQSLDSPFLIEEQELSTRVSIGVARYPEDGDCIESLLHVADQYMYREKKGA